VQEWTDNEIFPQVLATGLRRVAIVMSADFISQLSIEQVMTETNAQAFVTQYFDDVEKAKQWLLIQNL